MGYSSWFLMELIGAIGIILAGVYMYFKYVLYTYWQKKNVVYMEPSVPFGNIASFVMGKVSVGELYEKAYAKYKKNRYFGMYTFFKPSLVICDPDLIRTILTKNFMNFHDRGLYCNEEIDPLSGHLFLLPGIKWKNLRVKLSPTFTSGKMKQMFSTLLDCAVKTSNHLGKIADHSGIVEMKDLTARSGTDVIVSTAFGIESNSLDNPNSEFRIWGKKAFEPNALKNSVFMFAPKIMDFFKIAFTDKGVSKFFTRAFKETVEYRNANNVTRPDFMNLLMQLMKYGCVEADDDKAPHISENNCGKITMDEGIAQAFVFFIAGFETTSSTITHCLYELSRPCNKEIQEKTQADIDTVLKNHDGKVTYESTQEMSYLNKVINETLRKYPPVPMLNRVCTKELKLEGTNLKISNGTDIVIPVLGLHRDPSIYPDPLMFDPERFNEVNSASRHQYAYLPFGEGPRVCIGTRFGLLQTKIVLINLLSKYKFSLGPNTPDSLELDPGVILLTAKGGIDIRVEHR